MLHPRSSGLVSRAEDAGLSHGVITMLWQKINSLVDCSHYDSSISVHRGADTAMEK